MFKQFNFLSYWNNVEKMVTVMFVGNQCQGNCDVCIHYDVSLPQRIVPISNH